MSFTNNRFGKLTVIKKVREDVFLCRCDCGNAVELWRRQLESMVKRHCGCLFTTPSQYSSHGHVRSYWTKSGKQRMRTTGEYNSWKNMKERCYIPTKPEYDNYGGRGIRVCDRWLTKGGQGFKNFLDDMGPRPQFKTLDRINPQGHYEPTNCRWATAKVQAENQGRFIWKHREPPPVEDLKVMEARVEDWEFAEVS